MRMALSIAGYLGEPKEKGAKKPKKVNIPDNLGAITKRIEAIEGEKDSIKFT